MRSILLVTVALAVAECRTCDCAQNSAREGNETYEGESVEWFNDFLKNLYELNSDSIFQFLVETIDTQVRNSAVHFVSFIELLETKKRKVAQRKSIPPQNLNKLKRGGSLKRNFDSLKLKGRKLTKPSSFNKLKEQIKFFIRRSFELFGIKPNKDSTPQIAGKINDQVLTYNFVRCQVYCQASSSP